MSGRTSKRIMGIPDEFWIGFVIMVGIFLKLVFDIQVGYNLPDVNVGEWRATRGAAPGSGSIGVIQYYFNHHWLPDFDPRIYRGYASPPLYSIISSLIMEILNRMIGWDADFCLHLLQWANVVYVTVGTSCGIGMLTKLGVKGRKLTVSILFLTFFPEFYIMTAILNPDALCFMFVMLSLNSALDWYLTRRYKTIRSMAITMGLAVLTKYSAWMILPAVCVLFYYAQTDGRIYHIPLKTQFKRFATIFGILAFVWPVYNLIRFRLPLFYVDPVSGNWESFRGIVSAGKRLAIPGIRLLTHLHTTGEAAYEYNIWAQTFKTACFDFSFVDTSMALLQGLAVLLLLTSVFLCVLWHVMWVRAMIGNRLSAAFKVFLAAGYATILISYLAVCFRRPYAVTSCFRMIPEILIFPLAGMGLCGRVDSEDTKFEAITSAMSSWGILLLSVLSALLYGLFAM